MPGEPTDSAESAGSDQFFQGLVENGSEGVITVDSTGQVIYSNPAVENILGYTPDDLVGKQLTTIIPDRLVEDHLHAFKTYLRTGERSVDWDGIEFPAVHKDGHEVSVEINYHDHVHDEKRVFTGFLTDITERKEQENRIRQERNRFQTLFEKAPEGIAIHDRNGRFLEVNEQFQEELDYSRDALTSMNVADIESGLTPDEVQNLLTKMDVGETRKIESVHKRKDGSTLPVEVWTNKVEMDGDVCFLGFSRDITKRQKRDHELSKVRRRFETLIEAAPDPVFVADAETGKAIETSTAAADLLGLSQEGMIGQTITDVTPVGDYELYLDLFEKAKKENTTIDRLSDGSRPQLVTADGETVPVEISAGVTSIPEGDVVVGIFRDVSDRVEKEREIEKRNKQLESFANVVSHDLRNPLNVASGRLEIAQEEHDSEHLTKIEDALDRMKVLIADLLELAQQGEPVGEYKSVVISELAQDSWAGVDTKGSTIDIDIDRTIRADASRLKQIFENLFRNAIEHGGAGITVTVGELVDGFYVEDDGPGIPKAEREEVFQMGHSTKDEGTGFGLSIIKEIVEAHGWDITVTEGSEGGARFEITGVEFTAE